MTRRVVSFVSLCSLACSLFVASAALAAEPAIVYVERSFDHPISPIGVQRDGVSSVETATSGRLLLRQPDGSVQALVEPSMPNAPSDVADPAVSWDGSRVVFAGHSPAEDAWRIFEVGVDGSGLRQVTQSDREVDLSRFGEIADLFATYDDVDPCYLPDGRICFVSTRYPSMAPDERMRATNLYVVNADGTNTHRITSERFGADTPTVDPETGNVVYSRWWRSPPVANAEPGTPNEEPEPVPPGSPGYGDVGNPGSGDGTAPPTSKVVLDGIEQSDFPGLNNWFLASIHPDGDGMAMWSGAGLDRRSTQAYRPSFQADGTAVGFFLPTTPFLGQPGNFGLRVFSQGAEAPQEIGGPQFFFGDEFFDANGIPGRDPGVVPPDMTTEFVYASAEALPDGRLLVTGAPMATMDYSVFIQSAAPGSSPLPLAGASRPNVHELDAVPVVARPVPPIVPPNPDARQLDDFIPHTIEEAYEHGGKFKFVCENIFFNPEVDSPLPSTLPVGKKLFIEFFMNPQRQSAEGLDEPILIERKEIPPSGRIEMELPGGVSLFEVIRRADDRIAVGRDGQIFHVGGHNFGVENSKGSCVGCHAGHTLVEVPQDASWSNLAPSAVINASSVRNPEGVRNGARFFEPQNLVDRSTDAVNSVWAARTPLDEVELTFRWGVPIAAREVTVFGVRNSQNQRSSVAIADVAIETSLEGVDGQTAASGAVSAEGTPVALDPARPFDTMTLRVKGQDVSGAFEAVSGVAALAEVTVQGHVVDGSVPSALFVRGDANCDANLNITDPITVLRFLFQSGDRLCCEAGGDADANGRLNITDPVMMLNYHFRAGDPLPAPFPECGRVAEERLSCDEDACFSP